MNLCADEFESTLQVTGGQVGSILKAACLAAVHKAGRVLLLVTVRQVLSIGELVQGAGGAQLTYRVALLLQMVDAGVHTSVELVHELGGAG